MLLKLPKGISVNLVRSHSYSGFYGVNAKAQRRKEKVFLGGCSCGFITNFESLVYFRLRMFFFGNWWQFLGQAEPEICFKTF
jgi:hypothetical protein